MELEQLQSLAKETLKQFRADGARNDYIYEYRKIRKGQWEIPQEISETIAGLTAVVSSDPADSIDAAIRTFTVLDPSLRVFPNNITYDERVRAESIENILGYHFKLANQRGTSRPLERILASVLEDGGVALRVKYLPHDLKGNDKRTAAMKRKGDFAFTFYALDTVYPRMVNDNLESVFMVKCVTLAQAMKEYPSMGENIEKNWQERLRSKVLKNSQDALAESHKIKVTIFDYTDYENRVVWISTKEDDWDGGNRQSVVVMNAKHGLPFMPWIYREMSKPLLKTVVDFNTWKDKNMIDSLRNYNYFAFSARPKYWMKTISGEAKEIDYTKPGGTVGMLPQEEMGSIQAPDVDPGGEILSREAKSKLGQEVASRALMEISDVAQDAAFATVNALRQIAEASITLAKQTSEAAIEDVFYQMLDWIYYSGVTLEGRWIKRHRDQMGAWIQPGGRIDLTKSDFDPAGLYLCVELRPNTPTDKQARMNMAANAVQYFHVATNDALEMFGLDDMRIDEDAWYEEKMEENEFQNQLAARNAETQLQIQAAAQQQQMSMQNAQQAMVTQNQMSTGQGSLNAPVTGGQSPQQNAPALTREQISGRDMRGREL